MALIRHRTQRDYAMVARAWTYVKEEGRLSVRCRIIRVYAFLVLYVTREVALCILWYIFFNY